MARSVFAFESEDRVESPERLNEYIRVASPGVWVMVTALILILVALLMWGLTGKLPKSVSFKGLVDTKEGSEIFVTANAAMFSGNSLLDKEAAFRLPDGKTGKGIVTETTSNPCSREEVNKSLQNDFLTSVLATSDYSYILTIQTDTDLSGYDWQVADVSIITQYKKPIEYLVE